jgi:hypothetical protein
MNSHVIHLVGEHKDLSTSVDPRMPSFRLTCLHVDLPTKLSAQPTSCHGIQVRTEAIRRKVTNDPA